MMKTPDGFLDFLMKAKMNTYASDKDRASPSRPGSKDIHFEEGNYKYIDTYLGSFDFIGQEAVWYNGEAIWGMNYFGRMLIDEIPKGFIECLKKALKNVPIEAPYRGPTRLQYEQYEYFCGWAGEIGSFTGSERILLMDL